MNTKIIDDKIGKRRIKINLTNFDIPTKLVIKVVYPDDIDYNLPSSELRTECEDYIEEIRNDITLYVHEIFKNKFAEIDDIFENGSKLLKAKKDDLLFQFKLNDTYNIFLDTDNYASIIEKTFNKLKDKIDKINAKLEEKKIVEEFINNNPYLTTFPLARSIKREFVFHMGPTNSGKTYASLKQLTEANKGCYLAPLRLLAHEIYDDLNKEGHYCSLVTGEERIDVPFSKFTSSTIEMAELNTLYDVSIIDEIQMITDQHRGWAWTQAVCGLASKKIILAGSDEALPFVRKLVEQILGEKLTVVEFQRKNELLVEDSPATSCEENDAVIVFSRKRIFEIKKQLDDDCSIIYGGLSPEVRKSEARKFREGETSVVVSTDAIGMGLNLPIRRIIFADDKKFNGTTLDRPDSQLIKQIAGRAGRYGKFDAGYVTSTSEEMISYIKKCLAEVRTYNATDYKFQISPNTKAIELIASSLKTNDLVEVLQDLKDIIADDKTFTMMNLDSMSEIAKHVNKKLDLITKYTYSCAPINIKSEFDVKQLEKWTNYHQKDKQIMLSDIPTSKSKNERKFNDKLWFLENDVKLLTSYQWLNRRFPEIYSDIDAVLERIEELNDKIIKMLETDAKERTTNKFKIK